MDADVIVVGGGLAGLRCAVELKARGLKPLVLEAADAVGGRVRTDRVEGFQLDRGFQVLLTAYPECRAVFDYAGLELGHYQPGAMIRNRKGFQRLVDPWRSPSHWVEAALSPVGSMSDKLKLARLRMELCRGSVAASQSGDDRSTLEWLRQRGFSESIIEGFFRPFYGGIFLEPELRTSARMFRFVFKMFAEGTAALPAEGMQALPDQLAAKLDAEAVRLRAPVATIAKDRVTLEDGETRRARAVVLAVDMGAASRLTEGLVDDRGWQATYCSYFAAPKSPLPGALIALNATGRGPLTNVSIPSDVCPSYAPPHRSLICISTSTRAEVSVLKEALRGWFGEIVETFDHLRSYEIPRALPRQQPGQLNFDAAPQPLDSGVWLCGDYLHSSSLEGALSTGRRVGEALASELTN